MIGSKALSSICATLNIIPSGYYVAFVAAARSRKKYLQLVERKHDPNTPIKLRHK